MELTTLAASLLAAVTLTAITPTEPPKPNPSGAIKVGEATYGGSGCPASTAIIKVGKNANTLAIKFDDFVARPDADSSLARSACSISIPVEIAKGYQVAFSNATYTGKVSLSTNSSATLNSEYFFAGTEGGQFETLFEGALKKDYQAQHAALADPKAWSNCGDSVNLRMNIGLLVRTQSGKKSAATIDEIVFESGLVVRACR